MYTLNKNNVALACLISCLLATPVVASAEGQSDAKPVKLRYTLWDRNQLPGEQQLVNEFEKNNPGIKVEIELTPYDQYFIKLSSAVGGNVAPDVFWMNMPNFQQYVKNGMLEPLSNYLKEKSAPKLDDFVKSSVDVYQYQSQQYAIPRDIDAIAVWYNKKMFDQAGVSYPDKNWTWDDLKQKSVQLRKGLDKQSYPLAMEFSSGQDSYFNLLLQAGDKIVLPEGKTDVANDKAIAVYRDVQGMLNAGLIQPPGEMEASDVFQSNRAAMVYAGSWWALPFSQNELIKDHIGVLPMPKMAEQAGVSHSLAFAMSAKSQHKDAAWKFIEFMSSEHAQQTLATGKVVIPANQKVAKEWAEGFKGIDVSAYIDSLAFSHKYPTAGSNTAKWNSILNDGLKKVWTGTDPEKVMPGVAKRVEREMQK
ncbi:ABC transporter substrate-binding protein [Citrobacter portucalensis]|uniref:ABC transporter substrate-binding protein n=1 Tax=Citrobacter portucalensis TaxID=1639133 RepID=UPI00254E6E17|nr:sugar ABC transporter substrate-binding protein [Citrobacter portucalensis]